MRLVYILLAHQLPEQLIRLVDRLEGPDVHVLIHLDRNMSDHEVRLAHQGLAARANVEFLPRHRCAWGAFSLVEATLEGLRRCEALSYDYAVLLSGQDYPIKSRAQIDAHLDGLAGTSIIHHEPFPMEFWVDGGWHRIQQFHALGRPRWMQEGVRVLNALRLPHRFPRGKSPYGGAQFWALSQAAVRHVLDFIDANPKFVRFYRYTFVPDEMFFQSIVGNAGDAIATESDQVSFLEWDRPGMILTSDDFSTLTDDPHLFARKFDSRVDSVVLDRIDRELLSVRSTRRSVTGSTE